MGEIDLLLAPQEASGIGPDVQRELFELVSGATTREDPRDLLGELLQRALDYFQAERGFVLFREHPRGQLEPIAREQIEAGEIHSKISRTAVSRAQEAGHPILFGDTSRDLTGSRSTQLEGIRSILCAPLGADGALYLDSRIGTRSFGEEDLEIFTTMAGYARLSLELWREVDGLRRKAARAEIVGNDTSLVTGPSLAMRNLLEQLQAVAREDVTVLIQGETGTGKEVLAREIHRRSPRSNGPFVAIHCMSLAREVVESELFGHEKGAFTGAQERRLGRFELAEGGTLFLDEVGELSLELQVKLLRALQERVIERVGGARPIPLDIRVVAATNQPLPARIREGLFREDLYYRLNVFQLRPPPLRERPEDIPDLAQNFLEMGNRRMGKKLLGFSPETMQLLQGHDWPGNVRELANVVERSLVLEKSHQVQPSSIGMGSALPSTSEASQVSDQEDFLATLPPGLNAAREVFERHLIGRALKEAGGNVSQAAKLLEIPRSTVYRKAELLGIELVKKGQGPGS
jgi:transcriptional regulator with GAF, ATPase, and Fis domain